ncbi:MAG: biotin/lipoyl-containing protein, partial [Chloroflexota bacterium]
MATEIIMPQMGFDMKEGKVARWLKKEGDQVQKGEPIAEIETDKAVVEVEAFGTGVLRKVLVHEGRTVPVGEVIGFIGAPGEAMPDVASKTASSPPVALAQAATLAPASTPAPASATPGREANASPIARKLADEMGVDIRQVTGTGPGGRVGKDDILAYVEKRTAVPVHGKADPAATSARPAAPAPAGEQVIELTRMRLAIARRMAESKRTIPHFYVQVAIDMTEAMTLRKGLNDALGGDVKVSVNDMIV